MKFEKIKQLKCDDSSSSGPAEVVTLGMKVDDMSFIFGSFYYGPGMPDDRDLLCKKTEAIIDKICEAKNSE